MDAPNSGARLKTNPRAQPPELAGRSILVVGAARSGLGAARLLSKAGARVTVVDCKPRSEIAAARDFEALGARLVDQCDDVAGLGDFDLAVVSPGVPLRAPVMQSLGRCGIDWVSELELGWWFWPGPVAAVTGTNGKGTCCRLLFAMLKHAGVDCSLAGNIGTPLSACAADGPQPGTVAVVEVSSFQLAGCRQFAPQAAVLLNISADHLDWHESMEEYIECKRRIFANQRPDDLAVVVIDDELAARQVDAVRARLVRVSARDGADVVARGDKIRIRRPGGAVEIPIEAPLPAHLLIDAAAAAAVALDFGASPAAVKRAIEAYKLPEHLLEPVAAIGGVGFVNDSKATNVSAAVADLSALAERGPVVVITGGKDKGADLSQWAEALRENAAGVVLIGETARKLADMVEGAVIARSLDEAVAEAYRMAAGRGCVALIPAASSFDMFRDYADRGEQFKRAVRRLAETVAG